jgi:predicted transcriptional regulator
MAHTIELPDEVYERLSARAQEMGRTAQELIGEWVAEHATSKSIKAQLGIREVDPEEDEGDWRKAWLEEFGNLCDDPNASDNERIDADLAEESENTHDGEAKR